jgi:hypothetical protein
MRRFIDGLDMTDVKWWSEFLDQCAFNSDCTYDDDNETDGLVEALCEDY